MTLTQGKVAELAQIQADLKALKAKEMELRLEIHAAINAGRGPGTYRDDVGPYRIKSTIRYNYNIDEEVLSQLWDDMDVMDRECIRWKPSLNKKQYDSLGQGSVPLVDDCLIVKPGTPTISVEDNYE